MLTLNEAATRRCALAALTAPGNRGSLHLQLLGLACVSCGSDETARRLELEFATQAKLEGVDGHSIMADLLFAAAGSLAAPRGTQELVELLHTAHSIVRGTTPSPEQVVAVAAALIAVGAERTQLAGGVG